MLDEFYVDNYKSLINVTFRPQEQNLLLGMNNAGKTNLCQAVMLLAASSQLPLDKCAEMIAGGILGMTNFSFAKPTIDFRASATVPFNEERLAFSYELSLKLESQHAPAPGIEVESETLRVSGSGFEDTVLLENTRDGVRLLHEVAHLEGHAQYVSTSAPRDTTMLRRLYDLETNPRANCFKNYLRSWALYTLSPEALRRFLHGPNQFILNFDGSNLGSCIYHLKTMNERLYRELLPHLQRIDPRIDVINFAVPSADMIFMYFEDAKSHSLTSANASAGTLRFLAILYLLLVQPRFAPSPLLIIEEPENGIYVGFLKELLELVEEAPNRPQLIFTSHSPYFIDLFDNRLDGVFVLKRGEQHSSITQPDVQKVQGRLEKYPLGEQHFREMLG